MEGLKQYLFDEINDTPNDAHKSKLLEFIKEIDDFIESAFSEVEELLLEDGIVVPMEEYVRVVHLLNEATIKIKELC
jgi:hypothetical protein